MAELNYKLVSTVTRSSPVWLGEDSKTRQLATALRAEGLHVDAISFPAVPLKSGRLRIQLNAGHRREAIDHLVDIPGAKPAPGLAHPPFRRCERQRALPARSAEPTVDAGCSRGCSLRINFAGYRSVRKERVVASWPFSTCRNVRFFAAVGGIADVEGQDQAEPIVEYAAWRGGVQLRNF